MYKCKYCGKSTEYCDEVCDVCTDKIAEGIIPDRKDEDEGS